MMFQRLGVLVERDGKPAYDVVHEGEVIGVVRRWDRRAWYAYHAGATFGPMCAPLGGPYPTRGEAAGSLL